MSGDLGAIEQRVLLAIRNLHPTGYGVRIREEIERCSRASVSLGSVYAACDRLERRGFLRSREGEATAERGGRRKTYFEVTAQGRVALARSLEVLDLLREPKIVEGARA